MTAVAFEAGGYAYLPGVFQYSAGVAAMPGFTIERVAFAAPKPIEEGFRLAAEWIRAAGRSLTALCACELRSPAPFSEGGFRDFNRQYVATLVAWGLMTSQDEANPVARSNVCPEIDPPKVPSLHAFSFTRAAVDARPSFVIAGSGECPEGRANYRDHIVAHGDTSAAGIVRKGEWVLNEMERRMAAFNRTWRDTTAVQIYTVHEWHPLWDSIGRRGAHRNGMTWHWNRPPVMGLDFEMDCRAVFEERRLP